MTAPASPIGFDFQSIITAAKLPGAAADYVAQEIAALFPAASTKIRLTRNGTTVYEVQADAMVITGKNLELRASQAVATINQAADADTGAWLLEVVENSGRKLVMPCEGDPNLTLDIDEDLDGVKPVRFRNVTILIPSVSTGNEAVATITGTGIVGSDHVAIVTGSGEAHWFIGDVRLDPVSQFQIYRPMNNAVWHKLRVGVLFGGTWRFSAGVDIRQADDTLSGDIIPQSDRYELVSDTLTDGLAGWRTWFAFGKDENVPSDDESINGAQDRKTRAGAAPFVGAADQTPLDFDPFSFNAATGVVKIEARRATAAEAARMTPGQTWLSGVLINPDLAAVHGLREYVSRGPNGHGWRGLWDLEKDRLWPTEGDFDEGDGAFPERQSFNIHAQTGNKDGSGSSATWSGWLTMPDNKGAGQFHSTALERLPGKCDMFSQGVRMHSAPNPSKTEMMPVMDLAIGGQQTAGFITPTTDQDGSPISLEVRHRLWQRPSQRVWGPQITKKPVLLEPASWRTGPGTQLSVVPGESPDGTLVERRIIRNSYPIQGAVIPEAGPWVYRTRKTFRDAQDIVTGQGDEQTAIRILETWSINRGGQVQTRYVYSGFIWCDDISLDYASGSPVEVPYTEPSAPAPGPGGTPNPGPAPGPSAPSGIVDLMEGAPGSWTPLAASLSFSGGMLDVVADGSNWASAQKTVDTVPGTEYEVRWVGAQGSSSVPPQVHIGNGVEGYNAHADSAAYSPITFTATQSETHIYANVGSRTFGENNRFGGFTIAALVEGAPAPAPTPAPTPGPAPGPVPISQNLILNGDFGSGVDGWTAIDAVLSRTIGNEIEVANTGAAYGSAFTQITGSAGKRYRLSWTSRNGVGSGVPHIHVGNPDASGSETWGHYGKVLVESPFEFIADGPTIDIYLNSASNVQGNSSIYDTISLVEVSQEGQTATPNTLGKIAMLGDSFTRGNLSTDTYSSPVEEFGALLDAASIPHSFIGAFGDSEPGSVPVTANGGWTIADLSGQVSAVAALNPDTIFVYIGFNDIASSSSSAAADITDLLNAISTAVGGFATKRIFVCSPNLLTWFTQSVYEALRDSISAWCQAGASSGQARYFINLNDANLDVLGADGSGDGSHWSGAGADKVAALLRDVVVARTQAAGPAPAPAPPPTGAPVKPSAAYMQSVFDEMAGEPEAVALDVESYGDPIYDENNNIVGRVGKYLWNKQIGYEPWLTAAQTVQGANRYPATSWFDYDAAAPGKEWNRSTPWFVLFQGRGKNHTANNVAVKVTGAQFEQLFNGADAWDIVHGPTSQTMRAYRASLQNVTYQPGAVEVRTEGEDFIIRTPGDWSGYSIHGDWHESDSIIDLPAVEGLASRFQMQLVPWDVNQAFDPENASVCCYMGCDMWTDNGPQAGANPGVYASKMRTITTELRDFDIANVQGIRNDGSGVPEPSQMSLDRFKAVPPNMYWTVAQGPSQTDLDAQDTTRKNAAIALAPQTIVPGFVTMDAANYEDEPEIGWHDLAVIYQASFNTPDDAWTTTTGIPTDAGIQAALATIASKPGPIWIDVELLMNQPWPWVRDDAWRDVVTRWVAFLQKFKTFTARPVGIYSTIPLDAPLSAGLQQESLSTHTFAEMQRHNDMLAPLIAEVDFFASRCYYSYDGAQAWHQTAWQNIAAEGKRIARTKPHFMVMSDRVQDAGAEQNYRLLTGSEYAAQLEIGKAHFDGIIFWQGYDITFSEPDGDIQFEWPGFKAPWVQALEAFVLSHGGASILPPEWAVDWGVDFRKRRPLTVSDDLVFYRASGASVIDWAGEVQQAKGQELRIAGGRRVENLYSNSTTKGGDAANFNAAISRSFLAPGELQIVDDETWNVSATGGRVYANFQAGAFLAGDEFFIQIEVMAGSTGNLSYQSVLYPGYGASYTVVETSEHAAGRAATKDLSEQIEPGSVAWVHIRQTADGQFYPRFGMGSWSTATGSAILRRPMIEKASRGQRWPSDFISSGEVATDKVELIENGDFSNGATGWVLVNADANNQTTIDNGKASIVSDGTLTGLRKVIALLNNTRYKLRFDISESYGTGLKVYTDSVQVTGSLLDGPQEIDLYPVDILFLAIYRHSGTSGGKVTNISLEKVTHHGYGADSVEYLDSYKPINMLPGPDSVFVGGSPTRTAADSDGWITLAKTASTTSEGSVTGYYYCRRGAGARAEFLATANSDKVAIGIRQVSPAAWSTPTSYRVESGPGRISPTTSSIIYITGLSETEPTVVAWCCPIVDGSLVQIYLYPGSANVSTVGHATKVRNLMLIPFRMMPIAYDSGSGDSVKIPKDRRFSADPVKNGEFASGLTDWTIYGATSDHTITAEPGGARIIAPSTSVILQLAQLSVFRAGLRYRVEILIETVSGGIKLNQSATGTGETSLDDGLNSLEIIANSGTFSLYRTSNNVNLLVKSIRVNEIFEPVLKGAVIENLSSENRFAKSESLHSSGGFTQGHIEQDSEGIDGFDLAHRFIPGESSQYIYWPIGGQTGDMCVSCFVKPDDGAEPDLSLVLRLRIGDTIVQFTDYEPVGLGVWRCWATADVTGDSYTGFGVTRGGSASQGRLYSFTGIQAEEGLTPTSYIKTEGTAAVRNADVISWPGAPAWNEPEGTLLHDVTALLDSTIRPYGQYIFSPRTDAANRYIVYNRESQYGVYSEKGDASQAAHVTGPWASGDRLVGGFAYGGDELEVVLGGEVRHLDALAEPPPVDEMTIGGGANFIFGAIAYSRHRYIKEQLEELTADPAKLAAPILGYEPVLLVNLAAPELPWLDYSSNPSGFVWDAQTERLTLPAPVSPADQLTGVRQLDMSLDAGEVYSLQFDADDGEAKVTIFLEDSSNNRINITNKNTQAAANEVTIIGEGVLNFEAPAGVAYIFLQVQTKWQAASATTARIVLSKTEIYVAPAPSNLVDLASTWFDWDGTTDSGITYNAGADELTIPGNAGGQTNGVRQQVLNLQPGDQYRLTWQPSIASAPCFLYFKDAQGNDLQIADDDAQTSATLQQMDNGRTVLNTTIGGTVVSDVLFNIQSAWQNAANVTGTLKFEKIS